MIVHVAARIYDSHMLMRLIPSHKLIPSHMLERLIPSLVHVTVLLPVSSEFCSFLYNYVIVITTVVARTAGRITCCVSCIQ